MDVLKKAYNGVFSLQDYLIGTLPEPICQELLVNLRKGFQVFLSKTFVGLVTISSLQRSLATCLRSETDEQTRVVEEVVHELLSSGRRSNVLTLGLSRSGSCNVGLSFHSDHNCTQLITPHWSKLLQIIGKSFMKDLLLNTSIFTEVTSLCYIQLAGVPVHTILTEQLQSSPNSSSSNEQKVKSHCTNHINASADMEKAISAVTLCYDNGFHKKLHRSHPLNSLPASNIGANQLIYHIFQREKFDQGKVSKKKMKRIPQRLKGSKDLLKQLLTNFKKTRLQVFHQRHISEVDVTQQETCDNAITNEDTFVNEESPAESRSDPYKVGTSNACQTVVLQGNALDSCDDVQMGEENFICEGGRADGEAEIPPLEASLSEQSMEIDDLPLTNGGSFSKGSSKKNFVGSLRMQLQWKLKLKKTRRKNLVRRTASKSKQRNLKRGFRGNSTSMSMHGRSQKVQKGHTTSRKNRNALSMQFDQDSPLAKGLSGAEVYISLRGLLKKIIPDKLWGSTANQNAFFKYLKLLLKLGRFEKLPLSLMTKSLKFSDCDWTRGKNEDWKRKPRTDRIKRKELTEGLFGWLVTDLVVPLIRMLYYITETSVSKNELVYYPKEMWKKMKEKAIYDYKNSGVVTPVDEDNIKLMIMSQKTLGKSKLRFIPKETGFRPIVKMGRSTLPDKQKFGINLLLRDLLDVLTYVRRVHPQLFASSLLGITSIYPRWKEFAEKRHQEGNSRPLYFVKVDISKCYDSIPHNKLVEVVAAHLKQSNLTQKYLIRRYTVTSIGTLGDIRKKAMRHVTPVEGEHDFGHSFHQILCDLIKDGNHRKSVITNQASFHLETVDSLLSRLRQLINYDVVSIGNLDFLRAKGISQGSVLSSLLCSIFYGNMENRYLTGIDKDGLLMRLIDDFLLVTPHLHCATKFLEVLLSGECAEVFGCSVNPQKTLTNFEFTYENQAVQQLQGDWFPWCGFLFNVKTSEVKNDYQRYAATSFRYSMTLSFSSDDTLKVMKLKLIQALHRSKGLVIFIDPSINSQRVITESVYYLFLLTAFRFHSYHQALPQSLKRSNTTQNLLGIIQDIAPSFYFKAKKTVERLPAGKEFPLSLTAVKWLCIKAFDIKLSRHFGVYRRLLVVLRQQRKKLARKLDSSTRHSLSEGSTPDMPAVFNTTRI